MSQPTPHLQLPFRSIGHALKGAEIIATIEKQARDGLLPSGCRLPPVRAVSLQYGISKNTVQDAYEELVSRGLLENRARRGFFVAKSPAAARPAPATSPGLARFQSPGAAAPRVKIPRGTIPLSNAFIHEELLPREKFSACLRSVLRAPGIHAEYDAQGYAPLRAKIASRLRARGIPAIAEHVIITAGSQQALDIVSRALAERSIALENPAYSIGKKLFEMSGAKLTPLPINPFGAIQLSDWEERLRAAKPSLLYLTTNFQNPTGYSYSSSELARVLELSRELGFGLLEDDWGSDMLSFSELRPTLRSLGGERVLYANSFTKKLLPSLRLGYLLANDETLPSLMASKRVSTLACPTLMEMALFEFLDRGYYDSHLRALHRELDVRYLRALEVLREYLPAEVRFTTPGGGPLIWLEFPRGVSLPGLRERLAARRVQIEDPSGVFIGAPHLNGFRVGYAFLSPKDFERGIEILSQEIRKDL